MSDKFEEALGDVFDALIASAEKAARKTESCEKLFQAWGSKGIPGVLRELDDQMTRSALNATTVIREKLNRDVTKQEWNLIRAFPFVRDAMENHIKSEEGLACCVDKTFHRLAKMFVGAKETNTKKEVVMKINPFGRICRDCAKANGGEWPEGHVATCRKQVCEYCGVEDYLACVSDWIFMEEAKREGV